MDVSAHVAALQEHLLEQAWNVGQEAQRHASLLRGSRAFTPIAGHADNDYLAGGEGLEPTTLGIKTRCSTN